MKWRPGWDIHSRTQVICLGPALLLTLLLTGFLTFVRLHDLHEEMTRTGQLIANQLAPAAEFGVISNNTTVLDSLLRATLEIPHVRFLEVQDSSERVLLYVEQPDANQDHSAKVQVFQASIRLQRADQGHDNYLRVASPTAWGGSSSACPTTPSTSASRKFCSRPRCWPCSPCCSASCSHAAWP